MLQRVKIEGFKSLYSAEIELGTANVFIGANGSGKSNILEAVGVLGAAAFRSVEPEALRYRGVRPGLPALYKSSFERVSREAGATKPRIRRNIVFECTSDGALYRIGLDNPIASGLRPWNVLSETLEEGGKAFLTRSPRGCNVRASRPPQKLTPPKVETAVRVALQQLPETAEARRLVESLAGFCIFSPTTPVLRGLSDDVARIPLGLSGSGLAAAVKELLKAGEGQLGPFDLDEVWDLIEWADDVAAVSPQQASVSPAVSVGPSVLRFRDRFMKKGRNTLSAFDASEGALYVLFLLTLVAHEQAPRLFAVDNFDHALHPRLATRLTRMVVDQLLEDGSRQMLLTTHNPLLLDGLDLSDDRVRLFAVERSASGDTRVHRIRLTPELAAEGEKGLSLSRLWVMGRLGAVPRGL